MRPGKGSVARLVMASALLALPSLVLFLPTEATGRPLPQASSASLAERGRGLYEERCATCHGEQAEGTNIGPPIAGLGPALYDFMMSTGRMPVDKPVAQAMRRRPVLSPDEIHAITAYLVSIAPGGIPIPHVDPTRGTLTEGEQIWQLDCAPCHGTSGNGGAVGPIAAPPVHEATATQIAEAVRTGPGNMPVFGAGTMPKHALESLVRYALYLRHPDDRGGFGLEHIGPLLEGFLALTVGMGLVILATRYVGERS